MWVFPLAASVIALVFAGLLGRRFLGRRRAYVGLWAAAMSMYAAASFAVFLGVLSGWSAAGFRVYWLFGAILNVPFLAAGEVHLLSRRALIPKVVSGVLLIAASAAIVLIVVADVPSDALGGDLPAGKVVWSGQPTMRIVASVFSYVAYAYLLIGTAWSAWKMRGAPQLRDRFLGTLGIAVGATIVAAGAAFAVKGVAEGFSATLASGIAVMFWGFLRASRSGSAAQG